MIFTNCSKTTLTQQEREQLTFTVDSSCKRYSRDVIYTGDGMFILRLRVFEQCENVELTVKFGNRDIQGSPFCIAKLIPEQCKCPRSIHEVMRTLQCPTYNRQIQQDLYPYRDRVNFTSIKSQIMSRFNNFKTISLCNYVVKSGEVYRKCYGQYQGFNMFTDSILSSLTNKVLLPDLEFFVNLGDWPVVPKTQAVMPIFSWCGSIESFDIVLPTYEMTESTVHMMHRVVLDILSVQRENYEWREKIEKAFFRGRDSRRERLDVIDVARENPELFNASITNFFFFTKEAAHYGPKVQHIPLNEFFQYKYQINVDGTVAAYRLPYLLGGNSVVLKQNSPYYEHFYNDLKAYVHYVPFHRDPRLDLKEKVEWLRKNDDEAEKIMKNARNFVRQNLLPSNIICYYLLLLKVILFYFINC